MKQIVESLRNARKGDGVVFGTSSWSPESTYFIREKNPDWVHVENPGMDHDGSVAILSSRGTMYLITWYKHRYDNYDVWLNYLDGERIDSRSKIHSLNVVEGPLDPYDYLHPDMAERWPHV